MKLTRLTIREYAESLAVAFIMAMVIRHFVVEAFRIPTASMEPTLIGREPGGDRILVSKFEYDLHKPRPWDIIVFKIDQARIDYYRRLSGFGRPPRPDYYERHFEAEWPKIPPGVRSITNGTVEHPGSADYVNYVKRLVGLPGQTIEVINGDVYIDGEIARKPEEVENELLVPVTSDQILKNNNKTFFDDWAGAPAETVTAEDGSIALKGSATSGDCEVSCLNPVYDSVERHSVGDVKLSFRFRHTGGAGRLFARLTRDGRVYAFYVPLGMPEETPRLMVGNDVAATAAEPVVADGEHLVEFSNIDARGTLKVDGKTLISFDAAEPSAVGGLRNGIQFGAVGCDVAVRDVRLWRDIFYTSGGRQQKFAVGSAFTLGDNEYFVLGDNSPNSFDSRCWGVVKRASLIGEAFVVFWPVQRWKFIN